MAIAIRGTTPATATDNGGSATVAVTVNGTRQPQADEVLIIIHSNDFYDLTTMPTPTVDGSTTGVTAITNGTADAGTNGGHAKSYYWVNSSAGDRVVSVTETGAHDEEKALDVYVLSGVDTGTPIDVAGNTASATTGPTFVLSAVSPTSSDAFLIGHVNTGGGNSGGGSITPPGSMSEVYDVNVGGITHEGATQQLAASGSTGTRTFTPASDAGFAGLLIAVKTASAASTPSVAAATPPLPPHLLYALAARNQAMWQQSASADQAYALTQDDTAGLSDTAAATSDFARVQTDTAGLTDAATTAAAFDRAQTDTAGLVDTASTQLTITRAITDDTGVTDIGAPQAIDYGETLTDSAGLTDSASAQLTGSGSLTRTVDDVVGLTDTRALAQTGTITDTTGLTDSATAASSFSRTQTDTAGLTDSVSQQLSAAGTRQVDDSVGLTDAVTYSSTQTITDSLGLVDVAALALAAARSATDVFGLTDSVAVTVTRSVTVTDPVGLTDSVSAQLSVGNAHIRIVTDPIGLTSQHQAVQTTHRVFSGTTSRPDTGVTYRYPFIPD